MPGAHSQGTVESPANRNPNVDPQRPSYPPHPTLPARPLRARASRSQRCSHPRHSGRLWRTPVEFRLFLNRGARRTSSSRRLLFARSGGGQVEGYGTRPPHPCRRADGPRVAPRTPQHAATHPPERLGVGGQQRGVPARCPIGRGRSRPARGAHGPRVAPSGPFASA